MNNVAMKINAQIFVGTYIFISLRYIPRSEIAGPNDDSIFNILRNCKTVLQSVCNILHSHQQYMRGPVSPHSHQCFLISV